MPERKWQSKRFTYVCIYVHWKQKPGSHAYKVRTESEQHHLKRKQIDGNGSVQPNIYSLVFFSFIHFSDIVSLCSPSCPGTYFLDKTSLELRSRCLCLPSTGIKSVCHRCLACLVFLVLHIVYTLILLDEQLPRVFSNCVGHLFTHFNFFSLMRFHLSTVALFPV